MSEPAVLYDLSDGVATLTLNKPNTLNALAPDLLTELKDALTQIRADGARALLMTGAGRGFCSGADLASNSGQMLGPDRDLGAALEDSYHPILRQLRDLPCPIVTAVNGPAAGAGMSLALMGDFVFAAEGAYFLQAFINIGLVPDAGSTYLLPRLVGRARAMRLMMLGEKLDAKTAADWGLIHKVLPDETLLEEARALAHKFAQGPTRAYAELRRLAWESPENTYEAQLQMERDAQRDAGRTEDFMEGVQAFLAKRPAKFTGS